MRNIRDVIVPIGAAIAVAASLCAVPAVAGDAATEVNIAPSSARAAMAWAPRGKSGIRQVRHIRNHPARVASLAKPGCGWSASQCDRQFVLILGIGF
ncbi:MAG TPA: hypothetical protein VJR30_01375 [Bradyrhizobium sp.]|nr:hypothetical protein [Bradyrhizobium sp.]